MNESLIQIVREKARLTTASDTILNADQMESVLLSTIIKILPDTKENKVFLDIVATRYQSDINELKKNTKEG